MQWVGRPYPSRLRRPRINSIGLAKKVKQAHTDTDTTGMGVHLADAAPSTWM